MLARLSIRNVVLIDSLDLEFEGGLCVLTGETGAGKSILLDSLALALGGRSEPRFLRPNSEQASVIASFQFSDINELTPQLEAIGLDLEHWQEAKELILRRILRPDGRSRAFINDQPVSIASLRQVGDRLIEIQGQFEQRGLLDQRNHRRLLDSHAGAAPQLAEAKTAWQLYQAAAGAYGEALDALQQAQREEVFLRHAVEEMEQLSFTEDELRGLEAQRAMMKNYGRLASALGSALSALEGDNPQDTALGALGSLKGGLDSKLDEAIAALERAEAERYEAMVALQGMREALPSEGSNLEEFESRYFALHDMARKHRVALEELPALQHTFMERLDSLEGGNARLDELEGERDKHWQSYCSAAEKLSALRQEAAHIFDTAVNKELPALKLAEALFQSHLQTLEEDRWGPEGREEVRFSAATNKGSPSGDLAKIASGGELARFLLAIKVALADRQQDQAALVFDEVDAGVGGATAAAVGERLARLSEGRQILVVTHSPQVAARAAQHLLVTKLSDGQTSRTTVRPLDRESRREEIARMLSGAEVTQEARAAADRLMGAA